MFYRFLANAALGSTPLSSPLDSPDLMQTLLPYGEIGATTTSVSSVKLSMDNVHYRNQQVRPLSYPMSCNAANVNNSYNVTQQIMTAQAAISAMKQRSSSLRQSVTNIRCASALQGSISELPEINYLSSCTKPRNSPSILVNTSNRCCSDKKDTNMISQSCQEETEPTRCSRDSTGRLRLGTPSCPPLDRVHHTRTHSYSSSKDSHDNDYISIAPNQQHNLHQQQPYTNRSNFVEFSLSSVGRSFIDKDADDGDENIFLSATGGGRGGVVESQTRKNQSSNVSLLVTPDTPPPNISPSSSSAQNQNSETFSNNGCRPPSPAGTSIPTISPIEDQLVFKSDSFGGSWDLLELDLDFHQVNLDPSLGNIVEELVFLGDDPYGMLPSKPTEPNLLDL